MRYFWIILVLGCGIATGCHKKTGAENAASLDELNRALTVVAMHSGSFPPSTNDIATFLAIGGKTMPVPPSGKKLVIDPDKRQFILIDQ